MPLDVALSLRQLLAEAVVRRRAAGGPGGGGWGKGRPNYSELVLAGLADAPCLIWSKSFANRCLQGKVQSSQPVTLTLEVAHRCALLRRVELEAFQRRMRGPARWDTECSLSVWELKHRAVRGLSFGQGEATGGSPFQHSMNRAR